MAVGLIVQPLLVGVDGDTGVDIGVPHGGAAADHLSCAK